MIAQDEVMKQAQAKATEIVTQAQTKSKAIRQASQEFSDEVLRKAEESLAGSLAEVRQTRQALKGAQRQFAQQNNSRSQQGLFPPNIPRAVRVAGSSFLLPGWAAAVCKPACRQEQESFPHTGHRFHNRMEKNRRLVRIGVFLCFSCCASVRSVQFLAFL